VKSEQIEMSEKPQWGERVYPLINPSRQEGDQIVNITHGSRYPTNKI